MSAHQEYTEIPVKFMFYVIFFFSVSRRPDVDWSTLKIMWYRVQPELDQSEPVPIGKLFITEQSIFNNI